MKKLLLVINGASIPVTKIKTIDDPKKVLYLEELSDGQMRLTVSKAMLQGQDAVELTLGSTAHKAQSLPPPAHQATQAAPVEAALAPREPTLPPPPPALQGFAESTFPPSGDYRGRRR